MGARRGRFAQGLPARAAARLRLVGAELIDPVAVYALVPVSLNAFGVVAPVREEAPLHG